MKSSFKVSLGGVVGALSLVLMLITSIVPFGTYAFPAFAGMMLISIVIELGYSWAFVVYGIVSVLSLVLLTDKEAALLYVAFLGFYPVLKGLLEKLNSKVVQYILKFSVFNICMIIAFYVSVLLIGIPKESFNLFGVYLPLVFLLLGNIAFVVYDLCITQMVSYYLFKLHPVLSKNKTKL